MNQFKNLDKQALELHGLEEEVEVLRILDQLIEVIKSPEILNQTIKNQNIRDSHLSIYSSIITFLAELKNLISKELNTEELCHQYMVMIKIIIENKIRFIPNSLFGGLCDVGFGIHSLYKATSHYKKFLDSLNMYIVTSSKENIKIYKRNINNVKISYFDTMAGITGVMQYLRLYKDEEEIRILIEEGLSYLVLLTENREVYGQVVPSYYISPGNQFLEEEKKVYKKGNFNLGLSHGITGPLAALSLALNEGIEVQGQRGAIKRILEDLKKFNYIDDKGSVYWPGRIRFEDYINKKLAINPSRASWCYGTPGIARTMYIAGKAIDDKESIELSVKAINGLCNMKEEDWMLNSPTMCHGYAGLLVVMQAMYADTGNLEHKKCIDRLVDILLNFYKKDSIFGFMNIDLKEVSIGQEEMLEEEDITLLQGSIGVALTLFAMIKPDVTDWMKHFLV